MTIISALPYTLTNGTVADATQVMANFNQILNNVNANAQMGGATVNLGQTTANVNYVQVSGNTTGNAPIIAFTGTDSAVGGTISVKGASNLSLSTGGGVQVKINDTPSAVNFLNFTGGATGNAPSISATGSDTNVGLLLQAQGASGITCAVNSVTQFSIGNTGSAVNYLQVSGGAAGISPSLAALGSDTNLGMVIQCKGLGLTKFQNAAGVESFAIGQIASAVNYVQVNPAGTGTAPSIYAFGSDTNVGLNLTARALDWCAVCLWPT